MLHITILAVGRLKEGYLVKGFEEYMKRMSLYAKVNLDEVADERITDRASPAEQQKIREREAARIFGRLKKDTFLIVLDPRGVQYSSETMAVEFFKPVLAGKSHVTFVIGGTLGLTKDILRRADMCLSFSRFTFPHQLFRIILLEQIYRWFKIYRGESYHR